ASPTPAPPPKAPPKVAKAAPKLGEPIAIAFAPGSSEVPSAYRGPLKAIAGKRGTSQVIIVGYGEAAGTDTLAQSYGLRLGLSRAQAIAAVLAAAGVPAASMEVEAEAAGRGAALRLIN
ncbi:OmpA family protein, partial [Acidisphaera rubrifaciens]|uniref:OmpA family protein n=1 Tax=Acidisphaera rubrifaciens TaxID=50715 RepID=UPI0006622F8E